MRKDILEQKEKIVESIRKNLPKSYLCREFQCKPKTLDNYLKKMGIEYNGNMGLKGYKTSKMKKSPEHYLYNGSTINSHKLKNKLIEYGVKEKKCENCNIDDNDISYELHHIDGNRFNNELENLQILCPNCHSKTVNYGKRKIIKYNILPKHLKKLKNYCECGKEITKNAKRCEICEKIKQRKVKDRPSKEELILMIKESSLEAVGRKYNVSGNAVKKWLKMAV